MSRPDRSGADQIDAEHQATDLVLSCCLATACACMAVGLDLDSRTPSARSFRDNRFLAEPYFAAHYVSVRPGEQVVFMVRAFTSKCYCEWELLVEAVVDGKEQAFTVKDSGQPFRTTAFAAAYKTIYSFDFFGGNRFVKQPPGTKFPPPESGP